MLRVKDRVSFSARSSKGGVASGAILARLLRSSLTQPGTPGKAGRGGKADLRQNCSEKGRTGR